MNNILLTWFLTNFLRFNKIGRANGENLRYPKEIIVIINKGEEQNRRIENRAEGRRRRLKRH